MHEYIVLAVSLSVRLIVTRLSVTVVTVDTCPADADADAAAVSIGRPSLELIPTHHTCAIVYDAVMYSRCLDHETRQARSRLRAVDTYA